MALVPLADSANHHYNAVLTSKIFDSGIASNICPLILEESRTFKVSSSKDCPSNQEVSLLYAPLDNSELFLFFGFTLENNPFDSVKIELDMLDEGRRCSYRSNLSQRNIIRT